MRGRTGFLVVLLAVGLFVMTGCERRYKVSEIPDSSKAADVTEAVSETETAMMSETSPDTVLESVEGEYVAEAQNTDLTNFESSLNYQIVYDETLFQYTCTGNYDEIALKGQTFSSKPVVFFAAMLIEHEDIPDIMEEIFDGQTEETTIGTEEYPAICQPTVEAEADGTMVTYHDQYLVELANGDALLFEVQWYEEDGDGTYGELIGYMLDSLIIEMPVNSGVSNND